MPHYRLIILILSGEGYILTEHRNLYNTTAIKNIILFLKKFIHAEEEEEEEEANKPFVKNRTIFARKCEVYYMEFSFVALTNYLSYLTLIIIFICYYL